MSRSEARAAYEALPVPDTTEEHWRFTDLRGFDPDAFEGSGAAPSSAAASMLALDVAAEAVSFRYRDGSQNNGVPVADAIAEIVTAVRDRVQV